MSRCRCHSVIVARPLEPCRQGRTLSVTLIVARAGRLTRSERAPAVGCRVTAATGASGPASNPSGTSSAPDHASTETQRWARSSVTGLGGADADDEVFAGADAELVEDVPEVGFDGLDADIQLGCGFRLVRPVATRRARPARRGWGRRRQVRFVAPQARRLRPAPGRISPGGAGRPG